MEIQKIDDFAKRKGFFWPSSEIYGGFSGFYDYGSNGTLLKRKIEERWRNYFLKLDDNFFEIDASNIMPEKVFLASGHLQSFVDPVAKCKKCGTHHRADHILEDFLKKSFEGLTADELKKIILENKIKCPNCRGELSEVFVLNMMFTVNVGPDRGVKAYLRPETAQGVYINFLRHFKILRNRLPLGLAIVGKAYRNEISPRNLTVRMREFTQAELQIFFDPKKIDEHKEWDEIKNYKLFLHPAKEGKKTIQISCQQAAAKLKIPKFYVWHLAKVQQFFLEVFKVPENKFRFRELPVEERAFYNKIHWDVELNLESLGGFKEVGGVHYRTDHDLSGHEKISKESQKIFYDGRKFVPHVLELSFGVDRILYAMVELFYKEEKDRIVLQLPPEMAPIEVGIFPLVSKDGLDKKAREVFEELKDEYDVVYDDSGSIGKRYYREDERGTLYCVTIDYDTLKDKSVTIRDRDSTKQRRVKISDLSEVLCKLVCEDKDIEKVGKPLK